MYIENGVHKVVVLGDIHLGSKYHQFAVAALDKFLLSDENRDDNVLVLVGDMFHKPTNAPQIFMDGITFLSRVKCRKTYIVTGNHDCTGYDEMYDSALRVAQAGVVDDRVVVIEENATLKVVSDGVARNLALVPYRHPARLSIEEVHKQRTEFLSAYCQGEKTQNGSGIVIGHFAVNVPSLYDNYDRRGVAGAPVYVLGHIHTPNNNDQDVIMTGAYCPASSTDIEENRSASCYVYDIKNNSWNARELFTWNYQEAVGNEAVARVTAQQGTPCFVRAYDIEGDVTVQDGVHIISIEYRGVMDEVITEQGNSMHQSLSKRWEEYAREARVSVDVRACVSALL